MARKITIKRIGGCLPALCLLMLMGILVCGAWLSIAGLPQSILARIEQAAADAGVYLKLGAVKLAPSHGLAALRVQDIKLYAEADDATAGRAPLASVSSVLASVSLESILAGDPWPDFFELKQGKVQIPYPEHPEEALDIRLSTLSARSGTNKVVRLTEADFNIAGIWVKLRGMADLSDLIANKVDEAAAAGESEEEAEAAAKLDLKAELEKLAPYLSQLHHYLCNQEWKGDEAPSIDIDFRYSNFTPDVNVNINIPRYDFQQFRFRRAAAALSYGGGRIDLKKLHIETEGPDARMDLRGVYNLTEKRLFVNLSSNAPLIRIADMFIEDEEVHGLLAKFRHDDADEPLINLSGGISFSEDYIPLDIRITGELMQERLRIGQSLVEKVTLSVLYSNGNFRIENVHLALPDGYFSLNGDFRNGAGSAALQADIDIAALLALASEFTPEPILLPEELKLGGHTRFSISADLTGKPYERGQTAWQDYIPHVHNCQVSLGIDKLRYADVTLEKPEVRLVLDNLEQDDSLLPISLGLAGLRITLDEGVWRQGGEEQAALTAQGLSLQSEVRNTTLQDIAGDSPDIHIAESINKLRLGRIEMGQMAVDDIELDLQAPAGIHPLKDWRHWLSGLALRLHAGKVMDGDFALGSLELTGDIHPETPDRADLLLNFSTTDGRVFHLKAGAGWQNPNCPELEHLELELPAAAFTSVLEHFGVTIDFLRLPEIMHLKGSAIYNIEEARLVESTFELDIPELVRTPCFVKALKGKDNALAIHARGNAFSGKNGPINVNLALSARHETGEFVGTITADTEGRIHVTGNNTIRPDVIDALIDLEDAHFIMRDFRFTEASQTKVTDIDVSIDLRDDAVRVDSFCNAELHNAAFMLGGMEDLPDGNERVRQDLDEDPFSYVNDAACSVLVHVAYDCKAKDGSRLPDECVITLGNARMTYNNIPWLKYRGIKNGVQESLVTGDSIVIDIERSFVELNNIRGKCYPAYVGGMYFPDLQKFMSDVVIISPADVEIPHALFPIAADCKRPMNALIRAECMGDCGYRFAGVTFPLTEFTGFIYITDTAVLLDRLNAVCCEGVVNAMVNIDFSGKNTAIDVSADLACLNLKHLAALFDSEQKDALCYGNIRLHTPTLEINDIQAYGDVHIVNGDLLSLRLFQPVSHLLSDIPGYFSSFQKIFTTNSKGKETLPGHAISWVLDTTSGTINLVGDQLDTLSNNVPLLNHLLAYDLQEASAVFTIGNGHLTTNNLKAKGVNLTIRSRLDLDLNNLTLHGNIWPQISSLPTLILSPITFLSDYIVDINIHGPISDLKFGFGLDPRTSNDAPSASTKKAREDN